MTDPATEPREIKLREYVFNAKPTMSAKDFGVISRFAGGEGLTGDLFELLSGAIRNTLVAASRDDWDKIWTLDLDNPITFEEVAEFANRLAESEANRPTSPPSPSGPTASSAQTNSTDDSGSQAAKASSRSPSVPV